MASRIDDSDLPPADTILAEGNSLLAQPKFLAMTGTPFDDAVVVVAMAASALAKDGVREAGKIRRWRDRLSRALRVPKPTKGSTGAVFLTAPLKQLQTEVDAAFKQFNDDFPPFWIEALSASPTGGRASNLPARAFTFTLEWLWVGAGRPPLTGTTAALAWVAHGAVTQGASVHLGRRFGEYLVDSRARLAAGAFSEPSPVTFTAMLLLNAYRGPEHPCTEVARFIPASVRPLPEGGGHVFILPTLPLKPRPPPGD